jgi:hypothetical protein
MNVTDPNAPEKEGEYMRPDFTASEERLINYIRNHEATPRQVWRFYLPWIIAAVLLFAVGVQRENWKYQVGGCAVVLFFVIRFVTYQNKQDWRVKPIIDKYEEALQQKQNVAVQSMTTPVVNADKIQGLRKGVSVF